MIRRLLLASALAAVPCALSATVLIPIEFRELVSVSSTIVHGRVVEIRSLMIDGRRAVETFVTLEAEEYLKGGAGERLVVRVPGGQVGRYRTIFVGAPEFREGDEVVLFLRTAGSRIPYIVGLSQGAYRVAGDGTGRKIVTAPLVMGHAGDSTRVVRGDPNRRPPTIDAFRDAVRQVLAGR